MTATVVLEAIRGPLAGERHAYTEHQIVVIGRSSDCAIRLPSSNKSASRHHCAVEVSPPHAELKDLGSRHGTILNGRTVGGRADTDPPEGRGPVTEEAVALHDGDEIQVGTTVFRFTAALPAVPDGQLLARCNRCGEDVTRELPGRQSGSYVCSKCRSDLGSDPLGISRPRRAGPPPHDPGAEIPGHEIVAKVGAGGMGAVYLARRSEDGLWVALKVLLARVAVEESARKRFARESSIVEQLHHDHIVQFYERGSVGSAFYFTMEFCPGGSAAELMRRSGGKLTLSEAGPIVLQSLDALDYAHRREVVTELADGKKVRLTGVVHRDLKPDNILLTGSDRCWIAKLSDFGLAKTFAAAGLSGCTVSGQLAGALPYMPPEQVRDFRRLTPVSDVWSMGATLYAMLTGSDPRGLRENANPLQVILEGKVVPIQERDPDLPDAVATVVARSLEFDMEDRYPDASSFRRDLARALYAGDPQSAVDAAADDSELSSGTVLISAAVRELTQPVALLYVGLAASREDREDDVHSLQEIHAALTSQPLARRLTSLQCTGNGLLGACPEVETAVQLARGVQVLGTPAAVLRAVHFGAVRRRNRGDVVGREVQRLLLISSVTPGQHVPGAGDRLPHGSRLLVSGPALARLTAEQRAGLVSAGHFRLPGLPTPEELWLERLDQSTW